ncbi:hypothetical protein C772_02714 [Bhargavaea cecembensis DSE10]|uniref:Uncharacterized protein n=2 Tax=Bhargavaea cecembensis TaxID=394098 RepID=M7N9V9_9BACL|nr:hypothetical protein C772_02714 [Bhargavaea cecembensis DSE10]
MMKPSEEKFLKWFLIALMIIIGFWGLARVISQLQHGEFGWFAALTPFMMLIPLFYNLMVFPHWDMKDERWRRIIERSSYISSQIFILVLAGLLLVLATYPTDWTALQTVLAVFVLYGLTHTVITIVLTKRM